MSISDLNGNMALARRFMMASRGTVLHDESKAQLTFYFAKPMRSAQACEDWRVELEKITGRAVRFVNGGAVNGGRAANAAFMLAVDMIPAAPGASELAAMPAFAEWCGRKSNLGLWHLVRLAAPGGGQIFHHGDPRNTASTDASITVPTDTFTVSDQAASMQQIMRNLQPWRQALNQQLTTVRMLEDALRPLNDKLAKNQPLTKQDWALLESLTKGLQMENLSISAKQGLVSRNINAILRRGDRTDTPPQPGPS